MRDSGMGLVEMVVAMVIISAIGLGVASTMTTLSGKGSRRAGASSLELQALSYARANLEALRGAVSTDATRSAPLAVSATSYNTTAYTSALPALIALPSDFTSAPINGSRTYLVSSVATNGAHVLKQVKVTVQWTDA